MFDDFLKPFDPELFVYGIFIVCSGAVYFVQLIRHMHHLQSFHLNNSNLSVLSLLEYGLSLFLLSFC